VPDIDPQAAAETYERVYAPAFFHKLAQAGVVPASKREADALLRIGHDLYALDARDRAEKAASAGGLYEKAAAFLDGVVGEAPPAGGDDLMAKRAAEILFADPEVAAAAGKLAGLVG